ncbi:MAG: prepilin-type N-terminal cleavage/methylation domain-containing protein [Natronospirillum sp.]|uniref:pilus assembly FimT family protein n=1 Tax=Natronospirillum sp. TaxID=2812955 RepID=UPI0025E88504|nr:prepilin-type N-terminal cleavage/methylation domain-containing protein [Natronospirillum sp.]MCH8551038.1 prepilin-type N-terminal cleavage/methylation domain-containing protein [Natronospirillum sp.]
MPTSPAWMMNERRSVRGLSAGFSLLELLTVLIIMSVVVSLVALGLAPENRERSHERYMPQLQSFILEGYTTARLQRRDYALHWYRDQVHLYSLALTLDEQGDEQVIAEPVDNWELPDSLEFRLGLTNESMMLPSWTGEVPEADALHVLIRPDGTSDNPWQLELIWADDGELWQRLVSDGFNRPQWRAANE